MLKAEKAFVGDLLTILIFGLITIFMIACLILFRQVSDNNAMVQYTSGVVARHGGMTEAAHAEVMAHSEEFFGGRYTVVSDIQEPQPFGTDIAFVMESKLTMLFFDIPLELTFGGTSVSRRR